MFSTIIFAIKLIAIGIVVLIAYSIYHAIKEQKALDAIPIPEFPPVGKDGTKLMHKVEFTLTGVNHVHDDCDPQKILNPMMKGQWLTLQVEPDNEYDSQAIKVLYNGQYIGWIPADVDLNQRDKRRMMFERLMHGLDVPARFEHTTFIQVGGWDLDDNDPKLSDYEFTSAVITCGIYQIPGGRYKK